MKWASCFAARVEGFSPEAASIFSRDLIFRNAELWGGKIADVRIAQGRIVEIGTWLSQRGEHVIDALGGLLLPGLHDHHIHLAATAVRRSSVDCGPPAIVDEAALRSALSVPGTGWLRGVGYHERIAGMIDRHGLDSVARDRPVRVQDRTGRMWIFNSAGLDVVLSGNGVPPPGLERDASGWTGRLFDEDTWLRRTLAARPPDLSALGAELVRHGVTDMTPSNGEAEMVWLGHAQAYGALPHEVVVAGTLDLAKAKPGPRQSVGPVKIHLHEAHLPEHQAMVATIRVAHEQGRDVAVHCVTEVEMVFTLSAFAEAGVENGDRMEHVSVAPDELLGMTADLGLMVGVNPGFIHARGDSYRRDIAEHDWPMLYRLAALRDREITILGGSDAPYGDLNPWIAIRAATDRRTRDGPVLVATEAISAEQALALYLVDPADPARVRTVAAGAVADLCLLDRGWAKAREDLGAHCVKMTVIEGRIVHDRINQPPFEGSRR